VTPAESHARWAGVFTEKVDAVPPERWDAQSPVAEWRARDVVRHLVEWFPAFLEAGAGVRLPPVPSVDQDPAAAWGAHRDNVQALLDDPATADLVLRNPHIGEVPLPQAVETFYTADVFMHTWDLARATGQDDTLDEERCRELYDGMLPMEEVLKQSGQYGGHVDVPEDADVQTKLLALIGRRA
jgi:uncharacterized protein (TIGR03086 family)